MSTIINKIWLFLRKLLGFKKLGHTKQEHIYKWKKKIMGETKFEVFKDKSGQFRFRLKAENGEIIAASEAYTTKQSALDGIESVKRCSAIAAVVEADD